MRILRVSERKQCEHTLIASYYPRLSGRVEHLFKLWAMFLRRRESFRRDTEAIKLIIAHSICEKVPDRQTHKQPERDDSRKYVCVRGLTHSLRTYFSLLRGLGASASLHHDITNNVWCKWKKNSVIHNFNQSQFETSYFLVCLSPKFILIVVFEHFGCSRVPWKRL